MVVRCFLLFFTVVLSFESQAFKYKKDMAHFSLSYSSYNDINIADGSVSLVTDSVDFELGLRFKRLFRGFLAASMGEDGLRTDVGIGLRVDLPGVFLFGANLQDFVRQGMARPINTSFYCIGMQGRFENDSGVLVSRSFSTKLGVTLSWFPLSTSIVYLKGDFGIYTTRGNSYSMYGLGLGMAF